MDRRYRVDGPYATLGPTHYHDWPQYARLGAQGCNQLRTLILDKKFYVNPIAYDARLSG